MSAEGHQIKIILELLEAFEKSTTGDLPQEILDCIRMHGAIAVGASVAPNSRCCDNWQCCKCLDDVRKN